jgi:hypothetical protein
MHAATRGCPISCQHCASMAQRAATWPRLGAPRPRVGLSCAGQCGAPGFSMHPTRLCKTSEDVGKCHIMRAASQHAATSGQSQAPAPATASSAHQRTYQRLVASHAGQSFSQVAQVQEAHIPTPGPGEVRAACCGCMQVGKGNRGKGTHQCVWHALAVHEAPMSPNVLEAVLLECRPATHQHLMHRMI